MDSEVSESFDILKQSLVQAPVLSYLSFENDFILETDASVQPLGAILLQYQTDKQLHLVAYASRALSSAENNYSITELEKLAVVWAICYS